jgi:quercetin dioxygenase-like cupin family protein
MQKIEELLASATAGGYRQYHGGFFKVLLSAEQTGGAMALMDTTLPQGAEPSPHLHTREDEMFYLLEGKARFIIGDQVTDAVPGEAIFAPRQVLHQLIITTPTARFLTLLTPGDFLAYFLGTSVPTDEPKIVPPQGPPPAEVIQQMTVRLRDAYGVLFR